VLDKPTCPQHGSHCSMLGLRAYGSF
jgi:hypothetical protein